MNERRLSNLNGEITQVNGLAAVFFDCPCCVDRPHSIVASWAGSLFEDAAAWRLESEPDLDVLTLSPSIDCTASGTCTFHGFVRNGMVQW